MVVISTCSGDVARVIEHINFDIARALQSDPFEQIDKYFLFERTWVGAVQVNPGHFNDSTCWPRYPQVSAVQFQWQIPADT